MVITTIEFERGATGWAQLPGDGAPEVAFVGRSNVGKSSLFNMLVGRRNLARTSRTPGKTRELNFYRVNGRLYFVDLPGYGYARIARSQRSLWGQLMVRYLLERQALRAVLHLMDARHPPTEQDMEVLALIRRSQVPWLVVLTKADKLSGNLQAKSLTRIERILGNQGVSAPTILSSANTRKGRGDLLEWIGDLAA